MTAEAGFEPGHRHGSLVNKFGSIIYTAGMAGNWKVVSTAADYKTPTAPVSLEIIAGAADIHPDNGVGVGAHKARIRGLKTAASIEEEFEDIKLDGVTPVALVDDWWRVYDMEIIQSGVYASSTATSHNSSITLRETGAGDTWVLISPQTNFGLGQTGILVFTVSASQNAELKEYNFRVGDTNKAGNVVLFVREHADDIVAPFAGVMQAKNIHKNIPAGGSIERRSEKGRFLLEITGPADIGFMCEGPAAMEINGDFTLRCFNK